MIDKNNYFLSSEGVNDETATIIKLFFSSGDKVKIGNLIYSFETTKAVVDVEALSDGFIEYLVLEGDEIDVGSLVCKVSMKKKKIVDNLKKRSKEQKNIKPTKKALKIAQKYDLDINKLGLKGIIKEQDLLRFINIEKESNHIDKCLKIENNKFNKFLLDDVDFRYLSSKEKIKLYKENGYKIGRNVSILDGAVLIGNSIEIKDNVKIGKGTYIESPEIKIGSNTSIGNNCELVASKICIGDYNNFSNKVYVDISGGRFPDSNFITGKGCLIAYEAYINVCRQVKLGNNVALSPKSMIFTHSYWQSVLDGYSSNFGQVTIDDNSWLGSMAQILPDISVGTGSIIISNSLVSTNVKPFTMVGGVPAKQIKENLKKKLSKNDKENIIKKLFIELGDWFITQGYDINRIDNDKLKINKNEETKLCQLYLSEKNNVVVKDDIDILLCNNLHSSFPNDIKTIFAINNEIINGYLGDIERKIIDYFRRRGIRFYEE